ncbi:MAG TPA: aminoacyl-tRNA hydrolase [Rhodocyclaceae bacterium]|nr:aminoacyl-tRNA hydrolase [Rhodocyclaceae bacterium]
MSQPPRLVVGLGNPGPEYAGTRHNAGFWLAELIARELGTELRRESRFHGFVGHARETGMWILMPQTYMNRSGQSVVALASFYRILPDRILVLHDELDIPPGQLRLKYGGGLGGHNGLKDIAAHLGTQDFWRLRIGIGHPGDRGEVINYVLKPARAEEQAEIDRSLDRALELWPLIAKGEWERAIQRANTRPPAAPAADKTESKP